MIHISHWEIKHTLPEYSLFGSFEPLYFAFEYLNIYDYEC